MLNFSFVQRSFWSVESLFIFIYLQTLRIYCAPFIFRKSFHNVSRLQQRQRQRHDEGDADGDDGIATAADVAAAAMLKLKSNRVVGCDNSQIEMNAFVKANKVYGASHGSLPFDSLINAATKRF